MEIFKKHIHTPPHLFQSDAKYFITAATYKRRPFLRSPETKNRLFSSMKKGFADFGWVLEDWVILNNHYHLMAHSPENAISLSRMLGEIHRFNALWIKKNVPDSEKADPIWYNYRDTCITHDRSYFARLNYIWYNPVKHGYVENAEDWEFGSFFHRIQEDKEYLERIREQYAFDQVRVPDEY
jgi:putative transposase